MPLLLSVKGQNVMHLLQDIETSFYHMNFRQVSSLLVSTLLYNFWHALFQVHSNFTDVDLHNSLQISDVTIEYLLG